MSELITNRDIIVVSPQRWSNMWVSKHWISHELSKNNRVLFVGPSIWLGGAIKKPIGSDIIKKMTFDYSGKINANLHLFSALLIPTLFKRDLNFEEIEMCKQLEIKLKKLKFKDPIMINFGTNYNLFDYIKCSLKIYYCVDPPFPSKGKEHYELETCKKSDLIFAISNAYKLKLSSYVKNKDIYVVPHGYDFELASLIRESNNEIPADMRGIPQPIIGYTGSIHDAYVDTELLCYLAKSRPKYSFVLVGPYKNNPIGPSLSQKNLMRLKDFQNIYLLGQKKHDELPAYIKNFQACLILHEVKSQAEIAKTVNRTPFKLLHYFSQGKPVISSMLYELCSLSKMIYVSYSHEEYLNNVDASLNESDDLCQKRIQYASQFSYINILSLLSKLINDRF